MMGITFRASRGSQGIVLVAVDGEPGWLPLHAAEELLKQLDQAVREARGLVGKPKRSRK